MNTETADLFEKLNILNRNNNNILLFDYFAEEIIPNRDQRQECTYYYAEAGKIPIIQGQPTNYISEKVQQYCDAYGKSHGIFTRHFYNEELVKKIIHDIILRKTNYSRVATLKNKQPELYKTLISMVGQYLWINCPIRGYRELSDIKRDKNSKELANIEYIGNTIWKRKIIGSLSEDEIIKMNLKVDKSEYFRDTDEPLSCFEIRELILEFLKKHPLTKYNYPTIARALRIDNNEAKENLEYLLINSKRIISFPKSPEYRYVDYKWCPEYYQIKNSPNNKMFFISTALYKLFRFTGEISKRNSRKFLKEYFGKIDNSFADKSFDMLVKSGVIIVSETNKNHYILQELTDTLRKVLTNFEIKKCAEIDHKCAEIQ